MRELKSCCKIEKQSESPLPSPLDVEVLPDRKKLKDSVTMNAIFTKPLEIDIQLIKKTNNLNLRASMPVDCKEVRGGKKKVYASK